VSVTIVVRRRARSGQEAALFGRGIDLLQGAGTPIPPPSEARLFQGLDNPAEMLLVAVWESREAYLARLQTARVDEYFADLCAGPPERAFFQPVLTFDTKGRRASAVDCAVIHAPAENSENLRLFLVRDASRAMAVQPGLVQRRLYKALDDPCCFFVIHGWDSPAAFEQFRGTGGAHIVPELRQLGARVERFIGVTRAEVARDSPPRVLEP
jgi:quinol monooxygenase YgiN